MALANMAPAIAQQDPHYATPLKTTYRISGTFGEIRGNHYHAGLDMGTAGVEDIDVHAAEDGWVSRIKVGPYGYGRALYIDHPDGHTTVYGHLNGFAPKIDSLVRREQYAKESFDVLMFPEKGKIPVRRDEVVALSGNTGGSGGPHLHFEVRDTKTEEPLNPLRFISTAQDNTPPTLLGVKVYAVSPDAQVAGGQTDRYMPLAKVSGKTIDAVGTIGLGIHCIDYLTPGGRPCGIIQIDLYDGDTLVYHSRVDHFPFALNRHVNSHIDFKESVLNHRFVQRSFVSPGNLLPIYGTLRTPTLVREGETRRMRYEVYDFAGNKSTLRFTLRGRRNKALTDRPAPRGELVDWQRTWVKDTLGVEVLLPHNSLYANDHIAIDRTDGNGSELPIFSIGDAGIPLQKEMSVTMAVPEKWKKLEGKVFVARKAGKGIKYAGGRTHRDLGGSVTLITAKVSQFGQYTLGVDTVPPSVGIRNKTANVRRDGWIYIGVGDDKSGIANYEVRVDGHWEVFEYDYKKTRLKANVGYLGLKKGRHRLRAVVEDSCGNKRSLNWDFSVL